MKDATPDAAPRLSGRLLLGVPVVTAVASGLAVQAVLVATSIDPFEWRDTAYAIGHASIYVSVMWTMAVATFRWTTARWPLASAAHVARHTAAQTATAAVSFAVGSGLDRLAFGSLLRPDVFVVVATIAALSTALLAGILYGTLAVQRLRAAEAAAVAAELRALRAQINPHFLFNALNTVAALVRLDPPAAERIVEDLADLFRYSLAASERPTVTLAEEVVSARLFLGIEQARYGDALRVEVDVAGALERTPVPSLILQPLVENAVKHGVRRHDGRGTVRVSARADGDTLELRVADTGPGFAPGGIEHALGRGTGLTNVSERLRAGLGARASVSIDAEAPGGAVVVRLPLHAPPPGPLP